VVDQPSPSRKGIQRLLVWMIVVFLVVGGLLVLIPQYPQVRARIDQLGNSASVIGLVLTAIGFGATLWTIWETQRQNEEAQRRIEREVAAVRGESKQAVEKIRLKLLADELEIIRRSIANAKSILDREEGTREHWSRFIASCQEVRFSAIRLAHFPNILQDEKNLLQARGDQLGFLIEFVQRTRLKDDAPARLTWDRIKSLDNLLLSVESIRGRLQQLLMEIADGPLAEV
jgi:hypothetical protein